MSALCIFPGARFSSRKSNLGCKGGFAAAARPRSGRTAAAKPPQNPPTQPPKPEGCGVGARYAGVKRASAFAADNPHFQEMRIVDEEFQ